MGNLELLLTLAVVNGVFFIGYYFGKEKGLEEGRKQGEIATKAELAKHQFYKQMDQDLSQPKGLSKN